jgi:MFS family permease
MSVTGTWLQIVAQGWLVLQLSHSALAVGIVAALATIPSFFFSLFGGVIIDRYPKRQIILFIQTAAMILAFILGFLTIFNLVNVFEIGLLAFLLGVVNAIDWPARQSFMSEFLSKDKLQSAIAINSGIYNGARVLGPAIAGILIVLIGTGGVFILNGLSYIAVIIALFSMQVKPFVPEKKLHPIAAIKEGLSFSFNNSVIRVLLIFVGVGAIFSWSYSTMFPVIAQYTFHLGPTGLGYLYVAASLGALTATVMVSALAKKIPSTVFIFGGNTIFAVSIILFTLASVFQLALLFLFFAGFGLVSQFVSLNSTVQNMVPAQLRGRVLSVYAFFFIGFGPIGNFEVGYLSDKFGTSFAIQIGAVIVFVFGTLLFINRKRILGDLKFPSVV